MHDVFLNNHYFDPNGYWVHAIDAPYVPTKQDVALFDQNGYDLTPIEIRFAHSNQSEPQSHREHRHALKWPWITQNENKIEGAVLNHSLLFERKAYQGAALEQLQAWANELPILHKVIAMRPKWGLDFSMDYVDRDGNAFEILHWEWDSFDYDEIQVRKLKQQATFLTTDWDDAGRRLLQHKDQWHYLEFFEQSAWKCKYFGIENERFKMVIWE